MSALAVSILVGMSLGFFMGGVFIAVGAVMLLRTCKNPPSFLRPIVRYASITYIALLLSVLLIMIWGIIGAFLALIYIFIEGKFPGRGLGSPNIIYTLLLILLSLIATLYRMAIRKEKPGWGWISVNIAFLGIFGWLLPYFLSGLE